MPIRRVAVGLILAAFATAAALPGVRVSAGSPCVPTRPDALGPFYVPAAPMRTSVGKGFVLSGTVRGAPDCRALAQARLEFWLAGPAGQYGDAWRATVIADGEGRYRFESHLPPPYGGRPSHLHIRASAPRHQVLVTQYYPSRGQSEARFDLVLPPE